MWGLAAAVGACPHEGRQTWGHMTIWEGACVHEMVVAHWWPQVSPSLGMLSWEMGIAQGQALLWVA